MRRRHSILLLALVLALAAPDTHQRAAQATTLRPLDAGQLVDRAELVFTGMVLGSEVVLTPEDAFPFTFVTFRVDEVLKGKVEGRQLTLRFPGGEVGGEWVVAVGMPEFEAGDEVLLFVRGNGSSSFSPVVGWEQGRLRFAREARSGRRILVDRTGAPILGLAGGRWTRGVSQDGLAGSSCAVLIGTEGVTITAAGPEGPDGGPAGIPDAGQVVQALRSLLQSRAALPGFSAGRTVRSAEPSEIPARFGGALASPLPQ